MQSAYYDAFYIPHRVCAKHNRNVTSNINANSKLEPYLNTGKIVVLAKENRCSGSRTNVSERIIGSWKKNESKGKHLLTNFDEVLSWSISM